LCATPASAALNLAGSDGSTQIVTDYGTPVTLVAETTTRMPSASRIGIYESTSGSENAIAACAVQLATCSTTQNPPDSDLHTYVAHIERTYALPDISPYLATSNQATVQWDWHWMGR
jgi:hypothetical protein